ncbi:sensor histidine kinase [Hymenobacter seoulensis]
MKARSWSAGLVALFLFLVGNWPGPVMAVVAPQTSQEFPLDSFSPLEAKALLRRTPEQLRRAIVAKDTLRQRQLHWTAGQACHVLRRYESAIRHYRRALALSQPSGKSAAWSGWLLGRALHSQGDTGKARQTYQHALHSFRKLRDVAGQGQVLEHLGELYGASGQWARARFHYEHALAAWQLAHNQQRVAHVLSQIGVAHQQQRNYSRALYYLRQSLTKAQEIQDSVRMSEALSSTGRIYQELSNHEVAMGYFAKALAFLPTNATLLARTNTLQSLAATEDSVGKLSMAEQHLRLALAPAAQTGSKEVLSRVYYSLASVYRRIGQPWRSLGALTRYTGLQDSVFAEQRSIQVAELQTRYETEKKEREIQLLTKDKELQEAKLNRRLLQRNWLAAGTIFLLLAVVALFRAQRRQRHTNTLLQRKNAAINRQKEELNRLNRTKDTLFSIISHDLRGPLSSLYSLLALLKLGQMPAERLAMQSERVTRMLDSTLHLLDNLLNWSASQLKGEAGARAERLRLDFLADETVALLHGDAERKGIALLNEVPEGCLVRADVNMTRLVLRNLLNNALKFTNAGGHITLGARRQNQWWEIRVEDTGIGIDPADHHRVLGQGSHFSTTGTANEKGTGLGLRLCQEFVERNGGTLSFSSTPGQGSAFWFTLPALDEEQLLGYQETTRVEAQTAASADAG